MYPKIKNHYRYLTEDQVLTIFSKSNYHVLTGSMVQKISRILDCLDGKHSISQISNITGVSVEHINELLDSLEAEGILFRISDHTEQNHPHKKFIESIGLTSKEFIDRINSVNLIVLDTCKDAENIYQSIITNGFKKVTFESHNNLNVTANESLLIVPTIGEPVNLLTNINQFALDSGIPWIKINFNDSHGSVGPLFIPKQTGCYECYLARWYSNSNTVDKHIKYSDLNNYKDYVPGALELLTGYLIIELVKYCSQTFSLEIAGNELDVHFITHEIELRPLLKMPRCPSCSPLASSPKHAESYI